MNRPIDHPCWDAFLWEGYAQEYVVEARLGAIRYQLIEDASGDPRAILCDETVLARLNEGQLTVDQLTFGTCRRLRFLAQALSQEPATALALIVQAAIIDWRRAHGAQRSELTQHHERICYKTAARHLAQCGSAEAQRPIGASLNIFTLEPGDRAEHRTTAEIPGKALSALQHYLGQQTVLVMRPTHRR